MHTQLASQANDLKVGVCWLAFANDYFSVSTVVDALTYRCDHYDSSSCEGSICYSQVLWEEGKELSFWGCFKIFYVILRQYSSLRRYDAL